MKEFEVRDWRVESVYLGIENHRSPIKLTLSEINPLHLHAKYLFINNAFARKQRPIPSLNSENNDNLILAIQPTGVSHGRNGFDKDKSRENWIIAEYRRSKRNMRQTCGVRRRPVKHSTDCTDALDTLHRLRYFLMTPLSGFQCQTSSDFSWGNNILNWKFLQQVFLSFRLILIVSLYYLKKIH